MICVYPADCTDFSTDGNGTLSPLSAEVTERAQLLWWSVCPLVPG